MHKNKEMVEQILTALGFENEVETYWELHFDSETPEGYEGISVRLGGYEPGDDDVAGVFFGPDIDPEDDSEILSLGEIVEYITGL